MVRRIDQIPSEWVGKHRTAHQVVPPAPRSSQPHTMSAVLVRDTRFPRSPISPLSGTDRSCPVSSAPDLMASSFQESSCLPMPSGIVPNPPSRAFSHARTQTLRRTLARHDFSLRRSSRSLSLTSHTTSQLSKLAPRPVSPGTMSWFPTSTALRHSGAGSTSKCGHSNLCTNLNYCRSSRNCSSDHGRKPEPVSLPGLTLLSSVPGKCDISCDGQFAGTQDRGVGFLQVPGWTWEVLGALLTNVAIGVVGSSER